GHRLLAPDHEEPGTLPGERAALDVDDVGVSGGVELLGRLPPTAARVADRVERVALRAASGPHDRLGIEGIQRHQAGRLGVDFPVLGRGPNVDQLDRVPPTPQLFDFPRRDRRCAHLALPPESTPSASERLPFRHRRATIFLASSTTIFTVGYLVKRWPR